MKKHLSKSQAQTSIAEFFSRRSFTPEEAKKTKRMAMKHNIKLRNYRKLFCKKCLSYLKGKIRVTKKHKTIICDNCGYKNRFKLS